jgi:hypothetical protein
MDITELTNAGLRGWPLAFAAVGIAVCIVSFFIGWPWEGIIHKTYICKCKSKNCPCKNNDNDEDDE